MNKTMCTLLQNVQITAIEPIPFKVIQRRVD
jgi:hypothetical protein